MGEHTAASPGTKSLDWHFSFVVLGKGSLESGGDILGCYYAAARKLLAVRGQKARCLDDFHCVPAPLNTGSCPASIRNFQVLAGHSPRWKTLFLPLFPLIVDMYTHLSPDSNSVLWSPWRIFRPAWTYTECSRNACNVEDYILSYSELTSSVHSFIKAAPGCQETRFRQGAPRAMAVTKVQHRGALQYVLQCKLHPFYHSIMLGQWRLFGFMNTYRLFYLWISFLVGLWRKVNKISKTRQRTVPSLHSGV